MQTLATVRKSTKQGLSTWRFVKTEDGQYIAFGGVKPACKYFADYDQAAKCFQKYLKMNGNTKKTQALPNLECTCFPKVDEHW